LAAASQVTERTKLGPGVGKSSTPDADRCAVVRASPTVGRINLITGYDDKTDLAMVRDKLEELKQSLLEADVLLDIQLSEKIHDREVRIDNGWRVKIGRGLDFYQKPDGWFCIGASDLGLRKCLETKVDIFKQS
jgi:ATP-dependent Lon protease